MKHKERYTVYTSKKKVILRTNDIAEAFKTREEHKAEGAYVEDKKNKNKFRDGYLG